MGRRTASHLTFLTRIFVRGLRTARRGQLETPAKNYKRVLCSQAIATNGVALLKKISIFFIFLFFFQALVVKVDLVVGHAW